jgi:DNA protecting protein DprA
VRDVRHVGSHDGQARTIHRDVDALGATPRQVVERQPTELDRRGRGPRHAAQHRYRQKPIGTPRPHRYVRLARAGAQPSGDEDVMLNGVAELGRGAIRVAWARIGQEGLLQEQDIGIDDPARLDDVIGAVVAIQTPMEIEGGNRYDGHPPTVRDQRRAPVEPVPERAQNVPVASPMTAEVLEPGDAGYPTRMLELASPPRLWLVGSAPAGTRAIAVVGTRHPDRRGRQLARRVAAGAVARGAAVVSGLAAGIDTEAHRGALAAGGRTWAVVGCGVDVARTPEDPNLAADIMSSGGLLSEVPPGTAPAARWLVARDRLQSAMSAAVVVIQTDPKSGTMHTARFTLLQGRTLAVVAPAGRWDELQPGTVTPRDVAEPWRGNAFLCDPAGCPAEVLHASGAAASVLAARRPAADLVLDAEADLSPLWAKLGW